ncbi:LysR family transcriptional regulator [Pseudomonas typographi]|uniref:LysR family transcriptional regulator n=1 Tax=Pseudomonas typographi TaxID=2715964 RepID=A0ABR7Z320_9PSED|nr:LysR substrate-binding domain-containing protein [Pseudomonas typographi]MBD1554140.1 LysR family transcriptional regulator [Pseudomonas typographi]MBD1589605.1 LysR family transcriptional regulator [Pseudomonas typographi]MBD1599793.1 LysR family transcriptional regulator [Pseudomonas typographi]
MQLSQLRAFCAVARTGSVTAAARELHRVPSGVTLRIQQLEADLDCQLFVREKQRLTLSPSGRALLERAQQIIELSDSAKALVREEQVGGHLTLGALDVGLVAFMPQLVGQFRQRHPQVSMDVRSDVSEVLMGQVAEGVLDIALTDGPVQSPALDSRYAFSDDLVLITEKAHPAVHSASELRCREVYGFRQNCSFRLRLDRWLQVSGGEGLQLIEMESYHTMLACVTAGAGAAWVPRAMLNTLPGRAAVRVHSLGQAGRSELYFVWRGGHLTGNAQRLLDLHNGDAQQRY